MSILPPEPEGTLRAAVSAACKHAIRLPTLSYARERTSVITQYVLNGMQ